MYSKKVYLPDICRIDRMKVPFRAVCRHSNPSLLPDNTTSRSKVAENGGGGGVGGSGEW